jgi:hypothetical protein
METIFLKNEPFVSTRIGAFQAGFITCGCMPFWKPVFLSPMFSDRQRLSAICLVCGMVTGIRTHVTLSDLRSQRYHLITTLPLRLDTPHFIYLITVHPRCERISSPGFSSLAYMSRSHNICFSNGAITFNPQYSRLVFSSGGLVCIDRPGVCTPC